MSSAEQKRVELGSEAQRWDHHTERKNEGTKSFKAFSGLIKVC